ncbi:MAG: DUF4832 domain-containing protein [Lachnospiraceae bacterium]|nr:DUF4832 domain-containing protein [Lachnospiraceae bacterium]
MIRLLLNKNKYSFSEYDLSDDKIDPVNPARGWYKIYYFVLNDGSDRKHVVRELRKEQSLAMVFIDIADMENDIPTENEKKEIYEILKIFSDNGKDIILRFAYDHTGHAKEREPANFHRVLSHAKSIVKFLNECDIKVFIVQGVLIGNWGEMHSSIYANDEKMQLVAEEFRSIKESYLAVRKPSQWRIINYGYAKTLRFEDYRMGLFNDGMFGSQTDLGTYGIHSKIDVGYRDSWVRDEEFDFIGEMSQYVPIGGETVEENENAQVNSQCVVDQLKRTGITYLNSEHDRALLEKWKQTPYYDKKNKQSLTLYEYVSLHLGYRFTVKKAAVSFNRDESVTINVIIENEGFAPIYEDADVYIEISDGNESEKHAISRGLNGIYSSETKTLSASFRQRRGEVKIYAVRNKDGKTIRFANISDDSGVVTVGRLETKQ